MIPERRRVLIVDEDPRYRALLDAIFVTSGFEVTTTDSVLGASELIARERPHVIILDFALPYRSGASWLAQLRANPATANLPVVILAALPDDLPRARRELAQAVVHKPFRSRALVATVQTICDSIPRIGGSLANTAAPENGSLRIVSASTPLLGSLGSRPARTR